MLSALKSLFFIILAVLVLIILFFVGLILLVRGLLKKPLAEYAGSKKPKSLMIAGVVLMLLPAAAFVVVSLWSISSSVRSLYASSHYECVPDVWRNTSVAESQAENEIVKSLLINADKGSREAFARNFTPELQRQKGFDNAVGKFFDSYPVGLSECEMQDKSEGDAEYEKGENVRTDGLSFSCCLDDKWYFVFVEYCYRNTSQPDKVGVTKFMVMNLEAAAVYYGSESDNAANDYLICDIKSSSEVNARLIGSRPYVWDTSLKSAATEDELRKNLEEGGRLDGYTLMSRLGEPGVVIKHPDSTEFGYFYEIAAEDGEPRYIYIQTDSEYGSILYAFICTPYEVDYRHPVFQDEKYR